MPGSCPRPCLRRGPEISPAARRLWTGALLALFSLIVTSPRPALAENAVAVVTEPAGVNLRAGPGTHYHSLMLLPNGAELTIAGAKVNTNWLPVTYQGQMGFVFEEYIEMRSGTAAAPAQPGPAPPSSPAPAAQSEQMRVNSPEGLNLRAGPGTEHRVLTLLAHNTLLTISGRSADGRWAQIVHNGQGGWVDSQYLVDADAPTTTADPGSAAGSARYIWPVAGRSITTYFGPSHLGIDVDQFPSGGNPVVAAAAGTVIFAGGNSCCSYGLYVKVQHTDGTMTLSAHLQSIDVREGQEVAQGQTLGKSGNTGYSTGAHLHFEMHVNGGPVDPLGLLGR